MITTENLEEVLREMEFTKKKDIFEKFYPDLNCYMKVDFKNKKLIYPSEVIGNRNNTAFKPENFVVFECINKLLTKGYRPEHIELEKQWNLGHNQKGGRCDICVYN